MNIVVGNALPLTPTLGEDTIRSVRHGLADVLTWLGEDVGPRPGEQTHCLYIEGKLFVSRDLHERMNHAQSGSGE